jgi:hypothetical protein
VDRSGKHSTNRWHRKADVAARYGNVCIRTIDRAVEDGRLPPPKYPFGNKMPFWDGAELDAHDRNLAARLPEPAKGARKSEESGVTAA